MNTNDKLAIGRAILYNVEKKQSWVKPTAKRKGHWRETPDAQPPSREGTSRIEQLPEDIQNEILTLRGEGYSGAKIKANLESSIGSLPQATKDKLVSHGVISDTTHTLKLTTQAITDWAKRKGVDAQKKREPKGDVKRAETKYNITQDELSDANKQIETLTTENAKLKGELSEVEDVRRENVRHRDEKRQLQDEVKDLKHELELLMSERVDDYIESDDHGDDVTDMGDYGYNVDDADEEDYYD